MHVDCLVRTQAPPADLDFEKLLTGTGAVVLEALSEQLAQRWLATERGKEKLDTAKAMGALGEGQGQVMAKFLKAAEQTHREELAGFLIRAAAALHKDQRTPGVFTASLPPHKNMQAHSAAMFGAAAFLSGLAPLLGWVQKKRVLRFFDDDFNAAQLFLEEWSTLGDLAYQELQLLAKEVCCFQALGDDV